MSRTTELTEIQRYWLSHIEACEESGGTIKEYADEQGLSVGSLYNARHQLKAKGIWGSVPTDVVEADGERADEPTPAFQRVIVTADKMESVQLHSSVLPNSGAARCCIHLPSCWRS